MSEDYQWRQLGSIVNAVLVDAKAKAIRKGSVTKVPLRVAPGKARQNLGGMAPSRFGNGFLDIEKAVAPKSVQLDLPCGIEAAPKTDFNQPRSPRAMRPI